MAYYKKILTILLILFILLFVFASSSFCATLFTSKDTNFSTDYNFIDVSFLGHPESSLNVQPFTTTIPILKSYNGVNYDNFYVYDDTNNNKPGGSLNFQVVYFHGESYKNITFTSTSDLRLFPNPQSSDDVIRSSATSSTNYPLKPQDDGSYIYDQSVSISYSNVTDTNFSRVNRIVYSTFNIIDPNTGQVVVPRKAFRYH